MHRIATSRYYRSSLVEIERKWSVDDVADAHQALDYFAYAEALEIKATRRGF